MYECIYVCVCLDAGDVNSWLVAPVCLCVCVFVHIYLSIYLSTHTHTHTHTCIWLQVIDAQGSQVGGKLKRAVGSVANALGAIKTMFTRRSQKAAAPVSEL